MNATLIANIRGQEIQGTENMESREGSSLTTNMSYESFLLEETPQWPYPDIHPSGIDRKALSSLLELMLDVFQGQLEPDILSILLLDSASQTLSIVASRGLPGQVSEATCLRLGEGIAGLVAQEQVPVLIQRDEPPAYLDVELLRPQLTASFVVPVQYDVGCLGVVCASTLNENNRFSKKNLDWMIEVSNRLGPILVALQNQEKNQQAAMHLLQMVELIQDFSQLSDEREAITLTIRMMERLCGNSLGFFWNVKRQKEECLLEEPFYLEPPQWSKEEIDFFKSLCRQAIQIGKNIDVIPGYHADASIRKLLSQRSVERVCVLPVQHAGRLFGLLLIFPDRFAQRVVRSVELLGSNLAGVLERVDHLRNLENIAFIDELTRTYNRKYWMERFREGLARAERGESPLSIVLFDLDNFKNCNDRYGHAVGDQVLTRIAHTIRSSARNFDNVCRYGGEEFTVLLPDVNKNVAFGIAERVRKNVEALSPIYKNEERIRLSLSGGVATYPEHGKTVEELLEAADRAMYRAKREGKNRVNIAE